VNIGLTAQLPDSISSEIIETCEILKEQLTPQLTLKAQKLPKNPDLQQIIATWPE